MLITFMSNVSYVFEVIIFKKSKEYKCKRGFLSATQKCCNRL